MLNRRSLVYLIAAGLQVAVQQRHCRKVGASIPYERAIAAMARPLQLLPASKFVTLEELRKFIQEESWRFRLLLGCAV